MISRNLCRAAVVCLAGLLGSIPATLAQRMGHIAVDAVDLGPVPASAPVSVRLYLAPAEDRIAALDRFLVEVQDARSPSYRHWLAPAEFGARFGASEMDIAKVRTFAENQGLTVSDVSASGLRVQLSGTATQMEAAFAPTLHAYQAGSVHAMAYTTEPALPSPLAQTVAAVSGFDTLNANVTEQLGDAVDANVTPIVELSTAVCLSDVSAAELSVFKLEAKQAAAQGITVLATNICGTSTAGSFPATLSEVTAVAVAPGFASSASPEARPVWQWAPGLPDDGLRHSPDITVRDVSALTQTLLGIAASIPASAEGGAARLGNINATLYAMAPIPTVFTQPGDVATGIWEPATGLGLVNLQALAKSYPRGTGSLAVFVSGSATNYAPTHGQATTLMSNVSDISGQGGGVVPTGTITFATSTGAVIGTSQLVNGTASLTTKALPGGSVDVVPSYSGDSTYASGAGYGTYLSVQGEPTSLSASVAGSVPVGGTISVTVTAISTSGVGTPSGSISIAPQGIANTGTYTALLSGSNGTATATVRFPATQAGTIALLVSCISSDASFTCYSPVRATVLVSQLASTLSFTVSPNPPVTGTTTNFVAKVAGATAPAPAPTGNVTFYDNGSPLGMVALLNGTATYSNALLTSGGTHAFTSSYAGDVNYLSSNAATPGAVALIPTTTALDVSPNPPVNGSTTTLTATLGYVSSGTAATGTVQFYEDAALLGAGTVNAAGLATFINSTITGTTAHSFYAVYLGDTVYATSQSTPVTTQANTATVTTTTSVSASSTTVNTGNMVTLSATIVPTGVVGGAGPTGTVSFISSTQGPLGSAQVSGTGASLAVALTSVGAHSITSTYSGDATYKASTSTTPVLVTVGSVVAPVTLTVTPSTAAYSNLVNAVVSVSGVATTSGTGPAGSVVFTITPVGTGSTTLPLTSTVAFSPSAATASSASYAFAAPAPGIYTVTATCTGTNFSCTTTTATAPLVTVKGSTVTTVIGTPPALIAGQSTTLTATIAPGSALATSSDFTGTVTFYNAGNTALGMGTVTGNQATLTVALASLTGNVITAVYSGDVDWSASTSAALPLLPYVVPTATMLSTNLASALQGSNIVFSVSVTDAPSTTVPLPGTPAGTVTFVDQYNGQSVPLGTATLLATGPYSAVAQLSTSGLFHGVHNVIATYAGNASLATSSSLATVNITDYSVAFNPASLTLAQGASGSATLTVTSLSGFAGTVTLACTPPPNTATSCGFSPVTIGANGVSILTIGTTASHAARSTQAELKAVGLSVSLAAIFSCLLIPGRRRPALLAFIALCGLLGVSGCGAGGAASGISTGSGGSPLGTQTFTVVTSGSDGFATNRHNVQFQVTIQ